MTPEEFLLKTFTITIQHPFSDRRLSPQGIASSFELHHVDHDSLAKASISSISMVLSLCFVATLESFIEMYGKHISDPRNLMNKAANLFDQIVTTRHSEGRFPGYVDADYFRRWRVRYEEAQISGQYASIRIATITTFYQQATFSIGQEPAVNLSAQTIQLIGEDVYDNYCIGLRNLLGSKILH